MRAFSDRFIALVLALGVLVLGVLGALMPGAQAGPYEDALSRFTRRQFRRDIEGINGVVASGNARAAAIITALQDGRLSVQRREQAHFHRRASPTSLIDAATGEPVAGAPPADLAPVRLNNRLRRIVEAALGSLTLMAPDPGKRLEAAQAVFRSKRCERASRARPGHCQGDRCQGETGLDRGARRRRALSRRRVRRRQDRGDRP